MRSTSFDDHQRRLQKTRQPKVFSKQGDLFRRNKQGRTKLTKLYAKGLEISGGVLASVVSRTKGVSGAFIKELMRRSAQFQVESSRDNVLTQAAVDAAIEEMLFTGGALNRRLLGGEGARPSLND